MNPLFWDSLYNKIKDSILNEGPQDRIFEEIQKTPKPDIPAVVDRLISLSPTLDTENQLFRFFLYLRKFSEYFGTGIIQPYGSALLGYLESRYQGVVEVVLEMVKDLMGNEEAFRVFNRGIQIVIFGKWCWRLGRRSLMYVCMFANRCSYPW
eukprot:TRINITY_DN4156_c0_g1_i3.p1 TRINITY_DN4156_c0_g1~~TRINITY_DN4156_c0_g1_i3.p1  ORF type:complete len:152 (-),score=6.37 TRINITY_DN4156_c0_g1_i3:303-758(-)